MIDHIGLMVSNYKKSKHFYSYILAPLNIKLIKEYNNWAGFGKKDMPEFWIGQGNILQQFSHIAFNADAIEAVDRFYAAAIKQGATSKAQPKIRNDYYLDYYSAFIIDCDGNQIGAVVHHIDAT